MRSVGALLVALPVLAIGACALSPETKRAQAIYDAREKATREYTPTSAIELAMAIHFAYEQGDYTSNYAQLSSDVLSAQYALERVTIDGAAETPIVIAWRGVMYEDTGRVTEAREEYRKSFELKPSFLAGQKLVPIYGSFHDSESVINTCKRAFAELQTVDKKVTMIDLCRKELTKLVPPEQVLAWLDPASAAWFGRELERREKAALAEQEQRRMQKERAAKVAAYVQKCGATCHDRGVACQDKCTGDQLCQERCEATYNTCFDGCEAEARKALTPAPTKAPAKPLGEDQRTDPSARAASKA